jgi:hypothetical protein
MFFILKIYFIVDSFNELLHCIEVLLKELGQDLPSSLIKNLKKEYRAPI